MKKVSTQFKNVITAAFGLLLAFCVAVFACYAWFTSSKQVNSSGISANVDEAFITNYSCTPYSLKYDSENNYTVGDAYTEDSSGLYSINVYDQSKQATLMVIEYNVNVDANASSSTKLIFSGSDNDTDFVSVANNEISTDLSNGVSLRLLDSSFTNVLVGDTVSSSNIKRCFLDTTANNVKQQVIFNNIIADSQNHVTLYILMEYDDDNVSMLYDKAGSTLSLPISFAKDINLEIVPADEHNSHTYSKWTVEPYSGTESYLYTATRTCTDTKLDNKNVVPCEDKETVYINAISSSTNGIATATYPDIYDTNNKQIENYTITFNLAAAGGSADSGSSAATVSTVTISGDTSVEKDSTITLSADVTMSDSSTYSGTITWSSSNTSIATVDSSGVVTGVAAGTANITATADGVADTYSITVTDSSATAHSYSFSYTALTDAISTAGVTFTDSMNVDKAYLTGDNSFLTLVDGGTCTVRDGSSDNKKCIEVQGSALSVTFSGTGTLTISFASTGGDNTSDLALKDSNGNYITAESTTASASTTSGVYSVYGTTYVTITYKITEVGTYTIVGGIDYSRNTRINGIEMVDTY